MRNWCAALAASVLFALPLCAQQKSTGPSNDATNAARDNQPAAENSAASPAIHLSGNVFGLPEVPRPKPFPKPPAEKDTRTPGSLLPRYELAGMYYYINASPGDPFRSFGNHGGGFSFAYNASKFLSLTAEVAPYSYSRNEFPLTLSNNSVKGSMLTYLFGPRLNWRKFDYFVPFAHFLLGGASSDKGMTGTGHQSAFAVATGGGVDMLLTKSIAWRVAQFDYLMTNFSGPALGGNARQDNFRMGTGLVYRLGIPNPPPPPNHPPVAACSVNPTSLFAGSGDVVAVHVNADRKSTRLNSSHRL